jgi:hypothetical protein
MDLAWTAHAGENLAGYNVYRKKSGGAYAQINTSLVTANSYPDELAASGETYIYSVTAVAIDGYESAQSTSATDTLAVAATWIDDVDLPYAPRVFEHSDDWVGATQYVLGRIDPVVFRRATKRRISLAGMMVGKSNMDELLAALRLIKRHRYVDPIGEVFAFEVVSPIRASQKRPYIGTDQDDLVYEWAVEVAEV